jgi:hypothetical protein
MSTTQTSPVPVKDPEGRNAAGGFPTVDDLTRTA